MSKSAKMKENNSLDSKIPRRNFGKVTTVAFLGSTLLGASLVTGCQNKPTKSSSIGNDNKMLSSNEEIKKAQISIVNKLSKDTGVSADEVLKVLNSLGIEKTLDKSNRANKLNSINYPVFGVRYADGHEV